MAKTERLIRVQLPGFACDFCRQLKRSCNREKPCNNCRKSRKECVYSKQKINKQTSKLGKKYSITPKKIDTKLYDTIDYSQLEVVTGDDTCKNKLLLYHENEYSNYDSHNGNNVESELDKIYYNNQSIFILEDVNIDHTITPVSILHSEYNKFNYENHNNETNDTKTCNLMQTHDDTSESIVVDGIHLLPISQEIESPEKFTIDLFQDDSNDNNLFAYNNYFITYF